MSDEVVFQSQRRLIQEEGIYAEPAGATALPGLISTTNKAQLGSEEIVGVTGSGFKDADFVRRLVGEQDTPLISADEV
jgi:threonine synthase